MGEPVVDDSDRVPEEEGGGEGGRLNSITLGLLKSQRVSMGSKLARFRRTSVLAGGTLRTEEPVEPKGTEE